MFAYADPPYLGQARKRYGALHPDAAAYDDPETHRRLIQRLVDEYADGWALSLHTPALHTILPMCPPDVRVMAWVKPFCSFKPGVNPAYAWEPVIVRGGRRRGRGKPTITDWTRCNIALQRGLPGAKPAGFCFWLFEVLGMEPWDELHDLFPGTGAVTQALQMWRAQKRLEV